VSVIRCKQNAGRCDHSEKFTEHLKAQLHLLHNHAIDEK
jgi:hypothetical protein